jgi:predicted AAA+ superfamily ATPase
MYITRHGETALSRLSKSFGAVLVTGARQVGKTTMLAQSLPEIRHITLDDYYVREAAMNQPTTFFKDNPPPVFIDEVQYAPNLFPQIKMIVDEATYQRLADKHAENKKTSLFYMSGSQQFSMMPNVTESLAGRLGILNIAGLSLREIIGADFTRPFIPTEEYYVQRRAYSAKHDYDAVWRHIWRGTMPQLCANPNDDWGSFYGAYLRTYIERDIQQLTQVADEMKFLRLMTILAGQTGQLLNLASVSRDVGISLPTAERWLSLLVSSNIVYLLQPYFNNITKRVVKRPKLYFLDTGLAAYLTKWNTVDVLKTGAMAGAFFENFVVIEVLKSYWNAGILDAPLYYCRDHDMREIDLMIYEGGVLYPIEIKKHADPRKSDLAAFALIDNIATVKRGPGGVVCMYDHLLSLSEKDKVIPVGML